jgi:hypothetical protein
MVPTQLIRHALSESPLYLGSREFSQLGRVRLAQRVWGLKTRFAHIGLSEACNSEEMRRCSFGGFNLSETMAKAVRSRSKLASGELQGEGCHRYQLRFDCASFQWTNRKNPSPEPGETV